jgi:aspartate racemase
MRRGERIRASIRLPESPPWPRENLRALFLSGVAVVKDEGAQLSSFKCLLSFLIYKTLSRPGEFCMKILGIIGGIAPESTIEYYRLIVSSYRARQHDDSYPSLLINSINLRKMIDLIEAGKLVEMTDYLLGEVRRLADAGADFALLASNTPHIVFEDIQRSSPIPLLSIVEAACEAAQALGLNKVGLLGTRFTMQGRFYREIFNGRGITLVVPDPEDQEYLHSKYMSEFINGIFLPETRDELLKIIERLKEKAEIQGLILGGTELPLILRDSTERGIPFLDTTRIHVEAAIARMLS